MNNNVVLKAVGLQKSYKEGGRLLHVLKDVNLEVHEGESVAIVGTSGSGKTTLLNILAALDRPTEGMVLLDNQDLTKIRDSNISKFRRENLGFVFQDFNLLDNFSLRDNIYPIPLKRRWMPGWNRWRPSFVSLTFWKNILMRFPAAKSNGRRLHAL